MLSPELKQVIEFQKNKLTREVKTKNKLLSIVQNKIKNYASLGHTKCIVKIPIYIIGFQGYDLKDMTVFIYNKLHSQGYKTELLGDDSIFVSWDIKDIYSVQKSKTM